MHIYRGYRRFPMALLTLCWVLAAPGCGPTGSSSSANLIEAEALDQAGKTAQAIEMVRGIVQSDPQNADGRDMLWRLYQTRLDELQRKRQWKPALAVTLAALSLKPDDADMRFERARLEGLAGRPDTALQQFERARELGKDPYLIADETAHMLVRRKRFGQAINALSDLEKMPTPPGYGDYQRAGRVQMKAATYRGLKQNQQALDGYKELLAIVERALKDPDAEPVPRGKPGWNWFRVQAYASLVSTALVMGDQDQAEDFLEQGLAAVPNSPPLLKLKADMIAARGDEDAALEFYETAIKSIPRNVLYRKKAAAIYFSRGDLDAARVHLEYLQGIQPKHPVTRLLNSELLVREGHCAEATPYLLSLIKRKIVDPRANLLVAHCNFVQRQYEQALAQSKKALAGLPGNLEALQLKADSLYRLDSEDKAWQVFQQAATGKPGPYLLGAKMALRVGDQERAQRFLEQASALRSSDRHRIDQVLQALDKGDFSAASQALEELLN